MKVSVVIPTYNCARYISEAIDSVLAQTYRPHEVIVVDDGSTDDTESLLQHYTGRIRYFRKENGGVSTARNLGMHEADGELIAFLDSDDVWHPRKLEIQVECLRNNPEIGLLGTKMIDWPNAQFSTVPEQPQEWKIEKIRFEDLVVKNVLATSTIIIRKKVIESVGEFDPTLRGPEDYDYWLRCLPFAQAANLRLALTGYRMVAGSLGKGAVNMEAGMLRILQKLDEAGQWNGRWLLRRQAFAYVHYSCGYMYAAANRQGAALARVLRSMASYPWPFRRDEMRMSFARPRLMGVAILRMIGIKRRV